MCPLDPVCRNSRRRGARSPFRALSYVNPEDLFRGIRAALSMPVESNFCVRKKQGLVARARGFCRLTGIRRLLENPEKRGSVEAYVLRYAGVSQVRLQVLVDRAGYHNICHSVHLYGIDGISGYTQLAGT